MADDQNISAGWLVGNSILLELDTAVSFCCGKTPSGLLPPEITSLADALPSQWREEYIHFMGNIDGNPSILEQMAMLTNSLRDDDYQHATLSVRNLSIDQALKIIKLKAVAYGLDPDANLSPSDQLADLINRFIFKVYQSIGFQLSSPAQIAADHFYNLQKAVRVYVGGDLHEQFWQWMDRFYYQVYSPWRLTREPLMNIQKNKVINALGNPENAQSHPPLDWLNEKNPLRAHPELRSAVLNNELRVFFWIEPFGLHDNWLLEPGMVTISFSEPGQMVENYFLFTKNLAERLQAISDPTRLLILRLIRNFAMTNTDMADYLGISRPTVSIHASILRKAGLIQSQQSGRIMKHQIVPDEVKKLFADLERYLDLTDTKK